MKSPLVARLLRFSVFSLLLASGVVATVLSERMWRLWRPGELPVWAPFAAPACFLALLLVFALDRLVAVRREQEAAPRAFMQVGAAVFLLSLLLPQEVLEIRRAWQQHRATLKMSEAHAASAEPSPLAVLLHHDDDPVRQATCWLIGWSAWQLPAGEEGKEGAEQASAALAHLLEQVDALSETDPSADVRRACRLAAVRLRTAGPADECPGACEPDGDSAAEPDDAFDDGTEYL